MRTSENQNAPEPQAPVDENQIIAERRDKLDALRAQARPTRTISAATRSPRDLHAQLRREDQRGARAAAVTSRSPAA